MVRNMRMSPVTAQTEIPTSNPSKLMVRLSRHFKRKVQAEWTEKTARVDFGLGRCWMRAGEDALEIYCQAGNMECLKKVMCIIGMHVTLFGKKEDLRVYWDSYPMV
jgi:hypothetical protein